MPQLKQSVIAQIRKRLNSTRFTEYDFELVFPDSGSALVKITLQTDARHFFGVSEEADLASTINAMAGQSSHRPTTTESPGSVKAIEKIKHTSLEAAFDRISVWQDNVYEDLRTRNVVFREIDALRAQLDAHLAAHEFDPDEYFEASELDRLEQRLDALLKSFEDMEREHKITSDELEQLRNDVQQMKLSAQDVPKGVWASLAKNRFLLATRRIAGSTEGKQFFLDAAKKFLLGDAKF